MRENKINKNAKAWGAANKKRRVQPVRLTPAETLCIGYLKGRFEVGAAFIVARRIMDSAMVRVEQMSTITCDAIVDAAYLPKYRPTELTSGDVFFVVVDPTPEAKKLHGRDLTQGKIVTEVVIRLHEVEGGLEPSINPNGILRRVDLRAWCSSPARWHALASDLLRCDVLLESTHWRVARQRSLVNMAGLTPRPPCAPTKVACPGEEEVLALSFASEQVSDHEILSKLATSRSDDGMGMLELDGVSEWEISRLVELGAVSEKVDDFGELRFSIRPEGIAFGLQYRVCGAVYENAFERSAQAKASRKVKVLTKVRGHIFDPASALGPVCPMSLKLPRNTLGPNINPTVPRALRLELKS